MQISLTAKVETMTLCYVFKIPTKIKIERNPATHEIPSLVGMQLTVERAKINTESELNGLGVSEVLILFLLIQN